MKFEDDTSPQPNLQAGDRKQEHLSMRFLSVETTALYFAADRDLDLMAALSFDTSISAPVAGEMSRRLLRAVAMQHHEYLSRPIRNPRALRGMSALMASVLRDAPGLCARALVARLARFRPEWVYMAHTEASAGRAGPGAEGRGSQPPRRRWCCLARPRAAEPAPAAPVGPFQYLYRADKNGPSWSCARVAESLVELVQRAAELLSAFSGRSESADAVRSMELPLCLGEPARTSAVEEQRLFVTISGDVLVAVPIAASAGTVPGGSGEVRRLMHEEIVQITALMGFLKRHVSPKHLCRTSEDGCGWIGSADDALELQCSR
mmetsp:Transcript_27385/g.64851  ORF Transcript_27385/g.64851 Transcript_27385/m.64851 type:complete len:320 (-) Transcript_27385:391-1350(-)